MINNLNLTFSNPLPQKHSPILACSSPARLAFSKSLGACVSWAAGFVSFRASKSRSPFRDWFDVLYRIWIVFLKKNITINLWITSSNFEYKIRLLDRFFGRFLLSSRAKFRRIHERNFAGALKMLRTTKILARCVGDRIKLKAVSKVFHVGGCDFQQPREILGRWSGDGRWMDADTATSTGPSEPPATRRTFSPCSCGPPCFSSGGAHGHGWGDSAPPAPAGTAARAQMHTTRVSGGNPKNDTHLYWRSVW